MSSAPRIPSLDGLRAISIAFVLCGHLTGTVNFPAILNPTAALAAPGVRIFFVISGYLISTLLFQELDRTGRISLAGFYQRRAFRIFPAFYVYLIIAAGLGWVGGEQLMRAATYTNNYLLERDWPVAHIWSLSVEEQFYLLWPLTIVLFGRRGALIGAGSVLFLAPAARSVQHMLAPGLDPGIGHQFHTIADSLATGCLLAGFREQLWNLPRYRAFLASPWFATVPVAVLLELLVQRNRLLYLSAVGMTVLNLAIALIIDRAIRFPDGFTGRILNTRIAVFVGTLSYSLYLWQQPFLNRQSTAVWNAFPLNLALAFCAALVSYTIVEKPMIGLGRRLPWGSQASRRSQFDGRTTSKTARQPATMA